MLDVRPDRPSGSEEGWGQVVLRDGTAMAYRDRGTGPVLVLVHGWAASSAFFDDIAIRLSGEFRVICPDLRAHGATPPGQEDPTIPVLADDLAELLAEPAFAGAVAVGWSMGAMVLWSAIERHGPLDLAGLIVEDMSPRILNDADWQLGMASGLDAAASARAATAIREDWPGYVAAFAPRMFSRGCAERDPALVDFAVEQLGLRDPEAMSRLWSSMAEQDFREALGGVSIPVLIVHGERSQAYRTVTSHYLFTTLPDAVIRGFARSGHAPHLEQPQEFAQAVSEFAHRVQAGVKHYHNIEGSIS